VRAADAARDKARIVLDYLNPQNRELLKLKTISWKAGWAYQHARARACSVGLNSRLALANRIPNLDEDLKPKGQQCF
jgi:hypothetical protein